MLYKIESNFISVLIYSKSQFENWQETAGGLKRKVSRKDSSKGRLFKL